MQHVTETSHVYGDTLYMVIMCCLGSIVWDSSVTINPCLYNNKDNQHGYCLGDASLLKPTEPQKGDHLLQALSCLFADSIKDIQSYVMLSFADDTTD